METFHIAYIGIGSNQGDRLDTCRRAVSRLCTGDSTRLDGQSPFYETEPVGWKDQGWFINAVIRVHTDLEAHALHARLRDIEREFGRKSAGPRFGPRVLDLDLLFFDDWVVQTDPLEIPHPRLHERRFVLQPLCDIAPGLIHPVMGKTVKQLLSDLGEGTQVVLPT
jgi:2-amino-4-hydroxy-6-hydroxymethyldihydropteridine diphosphokinase